MSPARAIRSGRRATTTTKDCELVARGDHGLRGDQGASLTRSTCRPAMINITDDLVIQSDITVIGASARTTIIDGGAKYRGFVVTSSGIGRLSHLTIRNGAAGQNGSNNGGGILNLSGTVTLDHVRITGEPRGQRRRDLQRGRHGHDRLQPARQQHRDRHRRRHLQPRRRRSSGPRTARHRRLDDLQEHRRQLRGRRRHRLPRQRHQHRAADPRDDRRQHRRQGQPCRAVSCSRPARARRAAS